MTDDNKTEVLDEQLNEAFERLGKNASVPPETVHTRSLAGGLAIFVALIALGVASYPVYKLEFAPAEVEESTADAASAAMQHADKLIAELKREQQQQLTAVDERLRQLDAQLAAADADKDQVSSTVLNAGLEKLRNEVRAMVGTSRQDWILAEVEYLLRLANQQLLMQKDPQSALSLLRAADETLRDNEGLTAFQLREAINADIARLEAVEDLDTDGIYLRLAALAAQVERLHRQPYAYIQPESQAPVVFDDSMTLTQRLMLLLERAGTRLASLVDYRREGEVITPVLPPEEEYYLRQNLILKLQIAQLALLRRDAAVYQSALHEAADWVTRYFDQTHQGSQAMFQGLQSLSAIDIHRTLPDISHSLRIARDLTGRSASRQQPVVVPRQESNTTEAAPTEGAVDESSASTSATEGDAP
ncbi:MAG: uroporphyrinogen-III C-methyltransferase [Pseudomonadales bacterium]|nr:uroporphyrinogen-III C-methyltransferase [Pseudomonadales bacterium]